MLVASPALGSETEPDLDNRPDVHPAVGGDPNCCRWVFGPTPTPTVPSNGLHATGTGGFSLPLCCSRPCCLRAAPASPAPCPMAHTHARPRAPLRHAGPLRGACAVPALCEKSAVFPPRLARPSSHGRLPSTAVGYPTPGRHQHSGGPGVPQRRKPRNNVCVGACGGLHRGPPQRAAGFADRLPVATGPRILNSAPPMLF